MSASWRGWALGALLGAVFGSTAVLSQERERISDQERELVKKVHQTRDAYQAALERLRAYYVHVSNSENLHWSEQELTDYHQTPKHPYILDLDLPSKNLKPDKSIPKANRMFRQALDWLQRPSLVDRDDNYKRAELLFRRLLRDYPTSDKLDETCYYLGEIYSSKYFQHYRRAAAFYEQVILYEPNTNLDARLQAARVYERHISNHRRAIELYQEVLRHEVDPEQTREARRRLDVLLNNRSAILR